MKRIALFLAAAAATLASCVKENTLAPEQTSDNLVTIKALATKTTLNGTAVAWENTDKIAVVLNDDDKTMAEFSVQGVDGDNSANATFAGTIASGLEYSSAYTVYPSTAYSEGVISHTLPETQTGVVTSGMILSSALLDAEQLKAGNATASFHNALTLVKVIVPAGVQSVTLTSSDDALAGTLTFNEPNVYGILKRAENGTKRTVTLSTGSELAAGTHNLLVYPGIAHTLTLTMVGTDGAEYTSAVSEISFNAGEYRTIDLTKIFKVATADLHVVLPTGGTVEVPVLTTDAYEYEVSMSTGADAWISCKLPTKGFHEETITFTVAENTTGADREANVTITWADSKTKTFTIQQKNVYMDFVTDANGDPIQWEENFGVYTTAADANAGTNAASTYKNVFTIELSDDFSKGTYLVKNIFKAASYTLGNGQPVTNKGGQFYANYEGGKLILLYSNAVLSYGFTSDVTISYNESTKTFSAEVFPAYDYSVSRDRFIGGYTAAVKVEEEPTPGQQADPIAGEWDVTCMMGDTWGSNYAEKKGTMVISSSAGQYTLVSIAGVDYNLSLTFANNVLTGKKNGSTLTLTYDSATNTLTQDSNQFMTYTDPAFKGLVATKAVDLSGTYSGSGKYGSSAQYASSSFSDTFTIQKNNDGKGQYLISGLFCIYGAGGGSSTYYANYSGGTLTILAANSINHPYVTGSLQSNVTMSFSDGTFVLDGAASLSNYAVVASYSATKQ